jgi:HPt (histidine-containing phosphotransfer) domain-containing protein
LRTFFELHRKSLLQPQRLWGVPPLDSSFFAKVPRISLRRAFMGKELAVVRSLDALKEQFIERLHSNRTVLNAIAANYPVTSHTQHREIAKLAHGIAGAGGFFGFDHLSRRASELEATLEAESTEPEQREALSSLIRELDVVIAQMRKERAL